jgi:hypothetical protein
MLAAAIARMSVCAELTRGGKELAMALSLMSVLTNALRLNRVSL